MTGQVHSRRGRIERRYLRAAVLAAVALVAITVAVFLKENPFATRYEVRGVFASSNQLRTGNPVRIAGLSVGEVVAIGAGPGDTSVVTMEISDEGRPVHADATLAIEPRLILEGNLFVELRPGTPAAPELRSGATIPRQRTTTPVQLDQLLSVLDLPTRGGLHRSIGELADGLGDGGRDENTAPENRDGAAASTRTPGAGRPAGYDGLRRAVRELDGALVAVGRVSRAARGTQPGDLGAAIRSSGDVGAQLARDPAALADTVTGFERVTGALAAEDRALAASVRGFRDVLRAAPRNLAALDSALPTLTRFADASRPALQAAPATLRKTNVLLRQIEGVVGPRELPSLLTDLEPVTATLPTLQRRLGDLLPLITPVTDCVRRRIVPTLNMKIEDGPNTTGDPVWLDVMHAFTALTGASPNFDGNATTIRLGVTQGETTFNGVMPGLGRIAGGGPDIQGVRPTWLGYNVEPPYRPDQPCTAQKLPDLGKRSGPPPTWPTSRPQPPLLERLP